MTQTREPPANPGRFSAAGALILLLLWVYYSVQIFLLGAEFTKAFANVYGSGADHPVVDTKVVKI